MKIKQFFPVSAVLGVTLAISTVHGLELTDQHGGYKSKVYEGKIYNDRGKYTGMITSDGKMYDDKGNFTGQIKNQAILNRDGSANGFVRDGKIYDKDGQFKGLLKR